MSDAFALAPPASWPRVRGRMAGLPECLALAVLLHLLLMLVFGNTPGGSARPGEGVWGTLNIRLAGTAPAREEPPAPPARDAYSGPSGAANERRWGGRVRDQPRPMNSEAGAARRGTWNMAPTPRVADPLPPAQAPLPVTQPSTTETRSMAPLPRLAPAAPLPTAPPPVAEPPPIAPVPELALLPRPAETKSLNAPARLPAESVQPLGRLAPVQPVEPLPDNTPELQVPPATRRLAAPPAAAPAPTTAPLGRVVPVEAPALPAAAPELRALPPPVVTREWPTTPAPLPVDSQPLARPQPIETPRIEAPPALPELRPLPPSAATTETPAPEAVPSAAPLRPAEGLPRPAGGAPDAGATVGHDVATPASQPASQPRLNLDLPRPRGGELSGSASRGLVNLLPHPPEVKNKLAEDIEKAGKRDCRNAYSEMGLVAVVPLLADAVRKDGCRW